MRVRAKFRCDSIDDFGTSKLVKLYAVGGQDGESAENAMFHQASPHGELKITIDNPAAAVVFEAGAEYYLDVTRAGHG